MRSNTKYILESGLAPQVQVLFYCDSVSVWSDCMGLVYSFTQEFRLAINLIMKSLQDFVPWYYNG